jgi:thiamine biosynthesis lipoprotein
MWREPFVGLVLLLVACDSGGPTRVSGSAMGMKWQVQVVEGDAAVVRQEAETVFERWEQAVSLWRSDSELVRFNQGPEGQWMKVGDELWSAVHLAWEIAQETEGALDITLGPLVNLWGFGNPGRRTVPPSEAEILEAKGKSGWQHLAMDEAQHALKKLRVDLELNVNAVVEGLVLEELGRRLNERGYSNFLLELGGELLARGHSPSGGPWRVAIQIPSGGADATFSTMPLVNAALATSGTYRQHFEGAEADYSHLIDPQTGRPVGHRLTSVTVLDADCGRADGFATALLILGPERGRLVAERLGLRVFWIETVD